MWFRPPYPGRGEIVESVDWLDEIVSDESSFRRALKDLNFDPGSAREYLSQYREIIDLDEPRPTIREKLEALVSRREYRVEDSRRFLLNVPLFKLHSPSVDGAKVTYREVEASNTDRGWLVKIFGVGIGKSKTVRIVYTSEFVSIKGECLQVFVPLVLSTQRVGVYNKSGILKSRGIRAEIEGIKDEWTLRRRTCETLEADECALKSLQGRTKVEEFSLSKHRGSQAAKYKRNWAFDTARQVNLHFLEAFDLSFAPLASVKREQQLELEFELPGKYDYQLHYNSSGLKWATSD